MWKYRDFLQLPCVLLPPLGTILATVIEVRDSHKMDGIIYLTPPSVPGAPPHSGYQHEVQLRPSDRGPLQDGPLLPRGLVGLGAGEGDVDNCNYPP